MLLTFIFLALFIPLLAIQQRAGYLDYGIYAHLQIPFIGFVLLGICWWLHKKKSKASRYLILVPLAYILTTATTNILGEKFLQVDHSEDLPIRNRLAEYSPPNQPPTKSQILADLGQPLASAILSTTNVNVPEKVMVDVRYAPAGSEILVYEETDRNGRHFTYFIFIDPGTGRKGFHRELPGMLRDDQWPRQPLR
ncbi:MAG TPA: hypothetical protein VI753_07715 [Anaerolineales bacterium]|nr:hypothetical protein [Anaerolineales bacterium]